MPQSELVSLTADIVAAYVSKNAVVANDVPALMQNVHAALASLVPAAAPEPREPQRPAVAIRRSITPDAIYSLEDGKPYRSLKRHLMSKYGMTPEAYRKKWGLPKDYPMVAPNYASARSELAKRMGLGRKPGAMKKR